MQEPCVPAVPALGPEYGGVAGRGRSPARRSSPSSQGASQASLVVKRGSHRIGCGFVYQGSWRSW